MVYVLAAGKQRSPNAKVRFDKRIQVREAVAFRRNQLVLIWKTARELQRAHTKLTDKFDYIARVERPLSNLVTYEITHLRTGDKEVVNRRNLKSFYNDEDDMDSIFAPPGYPVLPLPHHEITKFPRSSQRDCPEIRWGALSWTRAVYTTVPQRYAVCTHTHTRPFWRAESVCYFWHAPKGRGGIGKRRYHQ